MEDTEKIVDVATIIALRKAEFFKRILFDNDKAKKNSKEIIANMDNKLFMGKEELENKKIYPKKSLSELGVDEKRLMDILNEKLKNSD